ncbi:MAG: hypothetical protein ABSE46_04685 [Terracidiphilus sp.]|jgi:hypothetical protein
MKLRIKGNSMRLRVSPSEMKRLLSAGRIEEVIHFGPEPDARLTYALEQAPSEDEMTVRYRPQEVTVILSAGNARAWAEGDEVGIYGSFNVGNGQLELVVEKDFACLDKKDGNEDTFPNPKCAQAC